MFRSVKEILAFHSPVDREVFLDLENSAPVLREVIEEMLPYFYEKAYGNPTVTNKPGWEAYEAIFEAAKSISKFIGAQSLEEIIFTHDENEANNLAIVGAALSNRKHGRKIVISNAEPLSIDLIVQQLSRKGFQVVKVPVDKEGFIQKERLIKDIDYVLEQLQDAVKRLRALSPV